MRTTEVFAEDHMYSMVMCPCSLDIEVDGPRSEPCPVETVEFTVTVTNDGNMTIVQMDVWSPWSSPASATTSSGTSSDASVYLNPGESKEFTFNYTVPTCEECCQSGYWLSYSAWSRASAVALRRRSGTAT